MQLNSPAHLWDASEAAGRAVAAVDGVSWNNYRADWLRQSAVERQIEIIGEALNRLRRIDETTAARIANLSAIIGVRNIIAHGYDVVDHERLWQLLHHEIPVLRTRLEELLNEAPPPE